MTSPLIDEIDHRAFSDAEIVQYYADRSQLIFGEKKLLEDLAPSLAGARILDIGVGAGRTTPFLLDCRPLAYIGVDYVPEMISRCRSRFPGVDFRVADARQLSEFHDGGFDFILFSWNGIDYVDHQGRLQVLSEVFRLLSPGGRFAFSTANGRRLPPKPWSRESLKNLEIPRSLRGWLYGVKKFLAGSWNYGRRARGQVRHADYAILVDPAHDFRVLRYFITPEKQADQLAAAGFDRIKLIDRDGIDREITDPATSTATIYYLCVKAG